MPGDYSERKKRFNISWVTATEYKINNTLENNWKDWIFLEHKSLPEKGWSQELELDPCVFQIVPQ